MAARCVVAIQGAARTRKVGGGARGRAVGIVYSGTSWIAAIDMGCISWFMLPHKYGRNFRGETADDLRIRINHKPLWLDLFLFCHKRFSHIKYLNGSNKS